MEKRTQKITMGAAVIAIFAVMILLNRQTGEMFQEMLMYLFPIPMVAFASRYGWKNGFPVIFAMCFFAFLFGTPMMIFYAGSEALIGLVLGDCVYRKAEPTKTLFIVMMMSAAINIIDILLINALLGLDLNNDIMEMQNMMNKVFETRGIPTSDPQVAQMIDRMMEPNFLKNMMIVSMILLGMVQGFLIYQLSLLILRRLQFRVQQPKSIYYFIPPKWTGYLALLGFMAYARVSTKPLENPMLNNVVQTIGICGVYYLVIFGFIAIMYYLYSRGIKSKMLRILLCLAVYFTFSFLVPVAGLLYIITDYRRKPEGITTV